jgi:hypothetical protein
MPKLGRGGAWTFLQKHDVIINVAGRLVHAIRIDMLFVQPSLFKKRMTSIQASAIMNAIHKYTTSIPPMSDNQHIII